MNETRVIVCGATCTAVCLAGCFLCVADGPVVIADAAGGTASAMTGSTNRPQD